VTSKTESTSEIFVSGAADATAASQEFEKFNWKSRNAQDQRNMRYELEEVKMLSESLRNNNRGGIG
jgi:hypothetical protein